MISAYIKQKMKEMVGAVYNYCKKYLQNLK